MKKIGIFYGPVSGSTEEIAHKLAKEIGEDKVDIKAIKDTYPNEFISYECLILGIATVGKDSWDSNHSGNDWSLFLSKLTEEALSGKTVALYGLGNQIMYPNDFVDDLGYLYHEIKNRGAKIVGECSTDGYEFGESRAVIDGSFIGLPIDEDMQDESTDERIKNWVEALADKFNL